MLVSLSGAGRQLPDELAPVDVVVAAEAKVGFEAAGLEDAPEGVDAGDVEAPLPARDGRLCGSVALGQRGLGEPRIPPRLADEGSGVEAAERGGVGAVPLGHEYSL